ncbi:MAG: hypothetical protein R2807_11605 [Chitinophagales bacterium]
MKNLMLILALFFLTKSNFAEDKVSAAHDAIKAGTTLHYIVNAGNSTYPFIVKIVSLDASKGIVFDYDLQSASPKKARVTMTKDAVENAATMYNFFSGNDVTLTNKVSVFMSQKMIHEAVGNGNENLPSKTAEIKLNESDENYLQFNNTNNIAQLNTDKGSFATQEIFNEDMGYSIRYIDDAKCPLIISMDLGWTVKLSKVEF